MKMLIGAVKPTGGTGYIKGNAIGSVEARRLIGYSSEFPGFYRGMTAYWYLTYMAMLCRLHYREAWRKAMELLDLFDLRKYGNWDIYKFSTGMRKKIGLAQAMIHDPEILLLDEPTANLDLTARMNIISCLKDLVLKKDVTIFISSHVLAELDQVINYVTLIDKGEICMQGPVNEIKKNLSGNRYILKTTYNVKAVELLKKLDFIDNINLNDNGEIEIITGEEEGIRRKIMEALLVEDIEVEYFSRSNISLESIYKSVMEKGAVK